MLQDIRECLFIFQGYQYYNTSGVELLGFAISIYANSLSKIGILL